MEKLQYKLEVFEGPMDLLLQLISKKKVSINDVPIMEIIEQYLEYVRMMQEDNLDVSSEFLEMAARLVYIKSVAARSYNSAKTARAELKILIKGLGDRLLVTFHFFKLTDKVDSVLIIPVAPVSVFKSCRNIAPECHNVAYTCCFDFADFLLDGFFG